MKIFPVSFKYLNKNDDYYFYITGGERSGPVAGVGGRPLPLHLPSRHGRGQETLQGRKFMSFSHCQELCQQASWLHDWLHQSVKPVRSCADQQVDETLDNDYNS